MSNLELHEYYSFYINLVLVIGTVETADNFAPNGLKTDCLGCVNTSVICEQPELSRPYNFRPKPADKLLGVDSSNKSGTCTSFVLNLSIALSPRLSVESFLQLINVLPNWVVVGHLALDFFN